MYTVSGQHYNSVDDVSATYHIPVSTILARLDQGFSIEEAVTTPRWSFTKITVKSVTYPSIAAAARANGLNPKTVRSRLAAGWSIERAFEIEKTKKVVPRTGVKGRSVTVRGITYSTMKEAAIAHGRPPQLLRNRLKKGLTPEQALELEPFPSWFIPGKGQKFIHDSVKRRREREAAEQISGTRCCNCCKQHKPLTDFHGQKEKALKCRDCVSAGFLRYRYNISLAEFNELRESQGGKCKICQSILEIKEGSSLRTKNVAVDHCHETGAVRGLLCSMCNKGLGCFSDNVASLEAAILYLQKSRET